MDYPDVEALPQNLKDTLAQHAPVNVYRMVMHSPGLAPGFFVMADAMFQANSLPPHLRELAILRVGYRYAAPYETHQHEMIAGYAGLSAEAIAAAASGDTDGLPADEVGILSVDRSDPGRPHASAATTATRRSHCSRSPNWPIW